MCVRRLDLVCLAVATVLFASGHSPATAADRFVACSWIDSAPSLEVAIRQARLANQKLLVIDFPHTTLPVDDRADNRGKNRDKQSSNGRATAAAFVANTLRDDQVQALLETRFVPVTRVYLPGAGGIRRSVDSGATLTSDEPVPVFTVCEPTTPPRVLHVMSGWMSKSRLLQSLTWVERMDAASHEEAGDRPQKSRQWLQRAHADLLNAEGNSSLDIAELPESKSIDMDRSSDTTAALDSTAAALVRAARIRDLDIRGELSRSRLFGLSPDALRRIGRDPELGIDVGHYLLSRAGTLTLDELEIPSMEVLGYHRQPMNTVARGARLAQKMHECADERTAVILVTFASHEQPNAAVLISDRRLRILDRANLQRLVRQCEVIEVTGRELEWLMESRGESISEIEQLDKIAFVVYSANGKQLAVLNEREAPRELSRVLPRAIKSTDR